MDEYLFIELARLQADRRRLEREQRDQSRQVDARQDGSRDIHREPLRRHRFAFSGSKQS